MFITQEGRKRKGEKWGGREKEHFLWNIRKLLVFYPHNRLAKVGILIPILLMRKCREVT